LLAHLLEVTLGHFAGGFGDALLLDRLGSILAGLLDLADDLGAAFLLEALARRVAVEDFLPLGIELSLRLRVKRAERFFFP
jgi:hypothetical protein